MATYVFLNVPAYGHVYPTLAVAHELVRRGEKVIYYLTEDFRASIEATGATFRGYQSQMGKLKPPTNSILSQGNKAPNALPFMMVDESANVLPQVLESIRAEQPDYILYDMMCMWGKIVARALHIPAILFRPSYAANERFNMSTMNPGANNGIGSMAQNAAGSQQATPGFLAIFGQINGKLAQLCRTYDVAPFSAQEMFLGTEPLTIVFIPKEFQPGCETFDERFVFVGPSLQDRQDNHDFPLDKLVGKAILYISLGTVFNNQAEFYTMCFAAFKDEPWLVVLSRGKNVDPASLGPIPDNFLVLPHVPQLEVLQYTSIFITHGGMNSTMESLYYGVPMVAVPQMPEQQMTAHHIQERGLGIALDKNTVTAEQLRITVKQVMADPAYRIRAQAMQHYTRAAGGYKRAADAIMDFEQTHRQSTPNKM